MDTIVIHALNSLLYASVLFLIAGGLSLIYGVMRIVNLAHGNLYAVGAYSTAWAVGRMLGGGQPSLMLYLLLPVGAVTAAALGAILEPTLLRPLYKRAEEYQLLITFGLLLTNSRGLAALHLGTVPAVGQQFVRGSRQPFHRRVRLSRLQFGRHRGRWHRRGGALGAHLQD
jgi:branched-chain amino acid transport system permease protein